MTSAASRTRRLPIAHDATDPDEARRVVAGWIDGFYNRIRRHFAAGMRSPIDYELAAAAETEAA